MFVLCYSSTQNLFFQVGNQFCELSHILRGRHRLSHPLSLPVRTLNVKDRKHPRDVMSLKCVLRVLHAWCVVHYLNSSMRAQQSSTTDLDLEKMFKEAIAGVNSGKYMIDSESTVADPSLDRHEGVVDLKAHFFTSYYTSKIIV